MLHLVIGPPRSGKSIYIEKIVAGYPGATIYIGTLPVRRYYRDIILRHQRRRPSSWSLVELIAEPVTDFSEIEDALNNFRNVLFEGLTFYILRLMAIKAIDIKHLSSQLASMIHTILCKDGETIIVDAPISQVLSKPERRIIRHTHAILARKAGLITYYENGVAKPLKRSDLLRFDRLPSNSTEDSRIVDIFKEV